MTEIDPLEVLNSRKAFNVFAEDIESLGSIKNPSPGRNLPRYSYEDIRKALYRALSGQYYDSYLTELMRGIEVMAQLYPTFGVGWMSDGHQAVARLLLTICAIQPQDQETFRPDANRQIKRSITPINLNELPGIDRSDLTRSVAQEVVYAYSSTKRLRGYRQELEPIFFLMGRYADDQPWMNIDVAASAAFQYPGQPLNIQVFFRRNALKRNGKKENMIRKAEREGLLRLPEELSYLRSWER